MTDVSRDSGSQQSIYYLTERANDPILSSRPDYYGELYPHMLLEDVRYRVMPVRSHAKVVLKPSDTHLERIISEALDPENHRYRQGILDAVTDFIHRCSDVVMAFGYGAYEIVYFNSGDKAKANFKLRLILPRTIVYRRGKLMQYVPPDIARQLNVPQFISIAKENVLRFDPPQYVGSKLIKIMDKLSSLSKNVMPDFAMEQLRGKSNVEFDSASYIKLQRLALAETTKLIGWNARFLLSDDMLEYYSLHRQLLFERFTISLRDSIISVLNQGILKIGEKLNFSTHISIEGLPTLDTVQLALSHLEAGDMPFNELLKPFSRL
jgi:hypothetical protein